MATTLPLIGPPAGRPLALVNGRLFTSRDDLPWVSAILVDAGRIVALGDDQDVLDAAPAHTAVVDLQDRMGMPGIHDAHTHLLFSGLRFRSGRATGELVERAAWPVQRAVPNPAPSAYAQAIRWAVQTCNRFGITSVQEGSTGRLELAALRELDAAGALTMHVTAHLGCPADPVGDEAGGHVDTRFIKIWLDGAPTAVPESGLSSALAHFDAEGHGIKIYCAAGGTITVALDAIEHVRRVNGADGPVHAVAHCGFVDEHDMARFAELNVVAEMSPALWHRDEPAAGFRFRTLERARAPMTVGSDWSVTPDPNLFPALQGILEHGNESLPLERAVQMLTIEGARAVGRDTVTGSIEVGKSADVILLDRDISRVPTSEVGDTEVLLTLFEGRVVHQSVSAIPRPRQHQF